MSKEALNKMLQCIVSVLASSHVMDALLEQHVAALEPEPTDEEVAELHELAHRVHRFYFASEDAPRAAVPRNEEDSRGC